MQVERMNERAPRIGILGAGFISDYHIQGLQAAGAEIVTIASQTEKSARAKAQAYRIPGYTADIQSVFEHADLEAVLILTPDFTHRDLAIAALRSGKAVYLQKPMARNSRECREILEAADQTGAPLFVSFMHRYFVEVERTKQLLAENVLGQVFAIRQRNATPGASWADWFYQKASVGGGVVMQLGVHGIDLLRYLFGEIEAVLATTALMKTQRLLSNGRVIAPDNEDLALVTYRMAGGALAVHEILFNEVAGTDRFRMEIYGEKGTAWLRTERGRLAVYTAEQSGANGWFLPDLPPENVGFRQHEHFLKMLSGEAPADSSAWDGLVSVLVAEAIYRSAKSGSWEEVERP
jgi:predicted dehydrogenase